MAIAYKPIEKPENLESFEEKREFYPDLKENGAIGLGNTQIIKHASQFVSGNQNLYEVPTGKVAYLTGLFLHTLHEDAVNGAYSSVGIIRDGNNYEIIATHRFVKKAEVQNQSIFINYNMPLRLYAGDIVRFTVSNAGYSTMYGDTTIFGFEKDK
tara:strand:- start:2091 stop:2555 length:465 start_codon:yes stop_codon:yes gene_type:complete